MAPKPLLGTNIGKVQVQALASIGHQVLAEHGIDVKSSLPRAIGVAPGRVEIAGHHTDYCKGTVYGFAISRGTVCSLYPSPDKKWRIVTLNGDGNPLSEDYKYQGLMPSSFKKGHWLSYVFGTVCAFMSWTKSSFEPQTMLVVSNLPLGSGLSSSASVELSVAYALNALLNTKLSVLEMALIAKKAENDFAGLGCGLLDQGVSAGGDVGCFVRIDTVKPDIQSLPCWLDSNRYAWLVVHSGVAHQLTATPYDKVADISRSALDILMEELVTTDSGWMDSNVNDFAPQLGLLKSAGKLTDVQFNCAMHVFTSMKLARQMEMAMRAGDARSIGACLNAVHRSLSAMHGVSCSQVDRLQAVASALHGVHGASMMGGGGGGAVLLVADREQLSDIERALNVIFAPPHMFEVSPSAGAWGATEL